jgi:hypothetical protein
MAPAIAFSVANSRKEVEKVTLNLISNIDFFQKIFYGRSFTTEVGSAPLNCVIDKPADFKSVKIVDKQLKSGAVVLNASLNDGSFRLFMKDSNLSGKMFGYFKQADLAAISRLSNDWKDPVTFTVA